MGASSRNAYFSNRTYIDREIKRADVTLEQFGKLTWPQYEHTNTKNTNDRADAQNYSWKTIDEAMRDLNAVRADSLEKNAKQLDSYVAWQKQRIKGWKPQPSKLRKLDAARSNAPKVHYALGHWGVACAGSAMGAQRIWNKTPDRSRVTCSKCIRDDDARLARLAAKAAARAVQS